MFRFIAAEYGSVVCDGVPLADIPIELQDARVFKLHLRGNGLHRFPDSKLEGTGKKHMYSIHSYTGKRNSESAL